MDLDRLTKTLQDPTFYGSPKARPVEMIETHISRVFLVGSEAYKLKKPVQFDFLDFSSREKRLEACREEVRLNRRLAPETYRGVVAITRVEGGGVELGGGGEPVDYLVHMRRLPAEGMFDRVLTRREDRPQDMKELATRLVAFYGSLAPEPVDPARYMSAYDERIRDNRDELVRMAEMTGYSADEIKRIHRAQRSYLMLEADVFRRRVMAGRIVEGHGDLRPENICLAPEPVVFDCVEFNREFRIVDTIDELCFLFAECERLGRRDAGETILNVYSIRTKDVAPKSLYAFYKSYRACVRAKVAALRVEQMADDSADSGGARTAVQKYLDVAQRESCALVPPTVVVVAGSTGTGKSTVAEGLAERTEAPILSTDRIRRDEGRSETSGPGDRYTQQARTAVYERLFSRIAGELAEGGLVIVDGTFLEDRWRRRLEETAGAHGARLLYLWCECPPEIAKERIAERLRRSEGDSEASPALVDQMEDQARAARRALADQACEVVDTGDGRPEDVGRRAAEALRKLVGTVDPEGDVRLSAHRCPFSSREVDLEVETT